MQPEEFTFLALALNAVNGDEESSNRMFIILCTHLLVILSYVQIIYLKYDRYKQKFIFRVGVVC